MNISKFVLVLLHSNTFCQLLLWSYEGKRRETLQKRHKIDTYATFWVIFDYFIDRDDRITTLSGKYPNLFNLICI